MRVVLVCVVACVVFHFRFGLCGVRVVDYDLLCCVFDVVWFGLVWAGDVLVWFGVVYEFVAVLYCCVFVLFL